MHNVTALAALYSIHELRPFNRARFAMKFHLIQTEGNTFTGYGSGYVEINGIRHQENLIAMPAAVVAPWAGTGLDALTAEDFAQLVALSPEIVLLGTGDTIRFPHPRLAASLAAERIGLEVMDIKAACRTFNVLAAEGRKVAAALLFQK
jgi:uncharacterized protein